MSLHYWFMFPIAILVATTAMASGIGGATFFAPIMLLGLGLPPEVAIGTGLITEVFGFASGLYAYARKRLIDFRLGAGLLLVTIPLALFGTWLGARANPELLKIILGVGLFAVAISFLRAPKHEQIEEADRDIARASANRPQTRLVTATGEEIRYSVCNRAEGSVIAGLGGLFVGLVSTGLGELNSYFLLRRCRVPSRVAVATSVFVVALTALSAAAGHLIQFVNAGPDTVALVASICLFTVPGVIIGAQLGSSVANRVSQHTLERGLGILFTIIAVLTLGEVLL